MDSETGPIAKSGDPRDDDEDPTEASNGDLPYYDSEAPMPPMPMAPPPLYPLSNDHSLPTPEEAVNMAAFRGLPPQHKRKVFLVLGSVLALTLIVGVSTGMATSKQVGSSEVSPEERLASTKSFLASFSSKSDINSKGSPQNLAAEWIAVTDTRQVGIPASTSYDDSYEFVQRYVLAVLYYATQGDSWNDAKLSHFLRSSSECRCVWKKLWAVAMVPFPNRSPSNSLLRLSFRCACLLCPADPLLYHHMTSWNFGLRAPTALAGGDKTQWKMGVSCNDQGQVSQIFLRTLLIPRAR
jgi:hypothetical protein